MTALQGAPVLAMDGIGLIGTVGFFGPAAAAVAVLAGIVWRDRRTPDLDGDGDAGGAPDATLP